MRAMFIGGSKHGEQCNIYDWIPVLDVVFKLNDPCTMGIVFPYSGEISREVYYLHRMVLLGKEIRFYCVDPSSDGAIIMLREYLLRQFDE